MPPHFPAGSAIPVKQTQQARPGRRRTIVLLVVAIAATATLIGFGVGGAVLWLLLRPQTTPVAVATTAAPIAPRDPNELKGLLARPPVGGRIPNTEIITINQQAATIGRDDFKETVTALGKHGYQWSVRMQWTGGDGSNGTLDLMQFDTAAHAEDLRRDFIRAYRVISAVEDEAPVEGVDGGSVFTVRSRTAGTVLHGVAAKNTIVLILIVADPGSSTVDDVKELAAAQHALLP